MQSVHITTNEVYSIQHYVIKLISDFRQVRGFLRRGTMVSPTNKTDHNDISTILLKVALNIITLTIPPPQLLLSYQKNEYASDCCLTSIEQLFSYIMTRTSHIQWDDMMMFALCMTYRLSWIFIGLAH